MLSRRNVTYTKCYLYKVYYTKCYLYKMLLYENVLYKLLLIPSVFFQQHKKVLLASACCLMNSF